MKRPIREGVAVSDLIELYLLEARAHVLFAEIARKVGVDAAERVFSKVIKEPQKPALRKAGRRKGIHPKMVLPAAKILSLAELVRNHKPEASERDVARTYLRLEENNKKPTENEIRRVTALLQRERNKN